MPEGHSIHRLAGQFRVLLGGQVLGASSPQGRFTTGAARLDGQRLVTVRVHGKHLFLGFAPPDLKTAPAGVAAAAETDSDAVRSAAGAGVGAAVLAGDSRGAIPDSELTWLHVHLGIYGSWRFTGDAKFHESLHWPLPSEASQEVRQQNFGVTPALGDTEPPSGAGHVIAVTLMDTGESATIREIPAHTRADGSVFAPHEHFADRWFLFPGQFVLFEPVGTVRLRLMNPHGVADLSGPNRCELLDWSEVQAIEARLGPDPLLPDAQFADFVTRATTRKKGIGEALMDQNVLAGVGNIYRAEALFAARLDPFTPAREVSRQKLRRVWDWLQEVMPLGVESGRVTTIASEDAADFAAREAAAGRELQSTDQRYYVYQRDGRPCIHCGASVRLAVVSGRKLYWCPRCQR